jgi:hypothetical protein
MKTSNQRNSFTSRNRGKSVSAISKSTSLRDSSARIVPCQSLTWDGTYKNDDLPPMPKTFGFVAWNVSKIILPGRYDHFIIHTP